MHGHHHDHSHPLTLAREPGHAESRRSERRKLALTLVVTCAILIAEVIGGLLSHSLALLSDAGHMLSDVVAQALSLVALVLASRPADARRTYGWYRLEILAALINGLTLIALSGGILWSAAHRLSAPVEIHTRMMMIIAGVGLLANLVGAYLLHDAKSLNVKGAYLHILGDTLSSVAVLIGGAVMFAVGGAYWLDPALSMLIGVFILYSSYSLVREAVDVLLETVPRHVDLEGVDKAIHAVDGVSEVHDLHIWTITSGMYALSAHIVVAAGHGEHNDVLLNKVKDVLLRDFNISHTTLQLESETYEHVGHVC
jgi:cobalt-zinc-cadmium efflux system protein